jgi:hypothetical protein
MPATGRRKQARSTPDWIAVERDYRAGQLSLRQLAAKHRCSHSGVANKARRENWTRMRVASCDRHCSESTPDNCRPRSGASAVTGAGTFEQEIS